MEEITIYLPLKTVELLKLFPMPGFELLKFAYNKPPKDYKKTSEIGTVVLQWENIKEIGSLKLIEQSPSISQHVDCKLLKQVVLKLISTDMFINIIFGSKLSDVEHFHKGACYKAGFTIDDNGHLHAKNNSEYIKNPEKCIDLINLVKKNFLLELVEEEGTSEQWLELYENLIKTFKKIKNG